jgi:HAMP domain-containing protein
MDAIETAERQYYALVPTRVARQNPAVRPQNIDGEKAKAWILDYVVPAIGELWPRVQFQEQATWSIRHLAAGSTDPERKLVGAIGQMLETEAKALLRIADLKRIAAVLTPAQPRVEMDDIRRDGKTTTMKVIDRKVTAADELGATRSQVEAIAKQHAWREFVCVEDYFERVGDLEGNVPGWVSNETPVRESPNSVPLNVKPEAHHGKVENVQQADLVPLFHSRLKAVGDLVVRFMWARINAQLDSLRRFREMIRSAMPLAKYPKTKDIVAETALWDSLQQGLEELRTAVVDPKALVLREAAATLVQVYLAFKPEADHAWLDLPDAVVREGAKRARQLIDSRRDVDTLERLAWALHEIQSLPHDRMTADKDCEEAISSGGLVLCEEPPQMFWEGKAIDVDWARRRKEWQFWLQLAKKTHNGSPLNEDDLKDDPNAESGVSTFCSQKSRAAAVVKEFCPGLAGLIRKGVLPRTYRLDLARSQIHICPTHGQTVEKPDAGDGRIKASPTDRAFR